MGQVEAIMKGKGLLFDDARAELARQQMIRAGVDPDTGLPVDDKLDRRESMNFPLHLPSVTSETLDSEWTNHESEWNHESLVGYEKNCISKNTNHDSYDSKKTHHFWLWKS